MAVSRGGSAFGDFQTSRMFFVATTRRVLRIKSFRLATNPPCHRITTAVVYARVAREIVSKSSGRYVLVYVCTTALYAKRAVERHCTLLLTRACIVRVWRLLLLLSLLRTTPRVLLLTVTAVIIMHARTTHTVYRARGYHRRWHTPVIKRHIVTSFVNDATTPSLCRSAEFLRNTTRTLWSDGTQYRSF